MVNLVRQDGFTYLYSDKKIIRSTIVANTNGTKEGCCTGEDQW